MGTVRANRPHGAKTTWTPCSHSPILNNIMADHHLVIKDLTVSYNRVPALHHISMGIGCGHCVALLGPNGAGNTPFFKTIVGLVRPDSGSIPFHGHQTGRKMGDVAYLPQ